jgi:hypothetical protein
MIYIVIGILAVTYCVSVIMVFVECHPISLYWRVLQDPGSSCIPLSSLSSTTNLDLLENNSAVRSRDETTLY